MAHFSWLLRHSRLMIRIFTVTIESNLLWKQVIFDLSLILKKWRSLFVYPLNGTKHRPHFFILAALNYTDSEGAWGLLKMQMHKLPWLTGAQCTSEAFVVFLQFRLLQEQSLIFFVYSASFPALDCRQYRKVVFVRYWSFILQSELLYWSKKPVCVYH